MSRQGTTRPRTLDNVKAFWNREAHEWGDDPRVTIRDHHFRLLELETITELIRGRRQVLDIGCGTGFSTLFYSQVVEQIVGADYAEEMVACAQRFLQDSTYFTQVMARYAPETRPALRGNVRFEQGNILDLKYPAASFDAIVAERVLINLPTRELQTQAVAEVSRVLQPHGLWALVEVTDQGHQITDRIRGLFGLPPLEKYWHNLYLDESSFPDSIQAGGLVIRALVRFETYQFLSKVVHPLVVAPASPEFLAGFNQAARIVSRAYPDYQHVAQIGLAPFLTQQFRQLLLQYDPDKVPRYDKVLPELLQRQPDFTGCSHQALYALERR